MLNLRIESNEKELNFFGPRQREVLEILWDHYPTFLEKERIVEHLVEHKDINTVASTCERLYELGLLERTQISRSSKQTTSTVHVYKAKNARDVVIHAIVKHILTLIKTDYPDEFNQAIKELYRL